MQKTFPNQRLKENIEAKRKSDQSPSKLSKQLSLNESFSSQSQQRNLTHICACSSKEVPCLSIQKSILYLQSMSAPS
ncbi:hypothetical protein FGO68_gene10370 [Halteria grandinella]|uniref:Uncharacterized protein n=1 Tax=Halteria grandinella TaxID=5974 RepID=A0A8J8NT05_HALGN|nr:hypothetical protein FGO68_gene10370 [Halteria grandinella]